MTADPVGTEQNPNKAYVLTLAVATKHWPSYLFWTGLMSWTQTFSEPSLKNNTVTSMLQDGSKGRIRLHMVNDTKRLWNYQTIGYVFVSIQWTFGYFPLHQWMYPIKNSKYVILFNYVTGNENVMHYIVSTHDCNWVLCHMRNSIPIPRIWEAPKWNQLLS